jgi:hypothetical protein
MSTEFVLKALNVTRGVVAKSESGITWTSDQVTYPADLAGGVLPDDAYSKSKTVLYIHKEGAWAGMYPADDIWFSLHGHFRAYEQLIENDPHSVVTPVMANVYVTYDAQLGSKAAATKVDVRFNALNTAFPPANDPRIRYVCQGHYEPAGGGHIPIHLVIEVDSEGKVKLIENRSSPNAVVADDPPRGIDLTVR